MPAYVFPSRLKPPSLIESLNYEEIFGRSRDRFIGLEGNSEYTALTDSDPAMMLLQAVSYVELYIRQRINDAVRGTLLTHAVGKDLDSLVELFQLEREAGESDESLRERVPTVFAKSSTAGSEIGYRLHAIGTDVDTDGGVKDVFIDVPERGVVNIYILTNNMNGIPSNLLLTEVANNLKDYRPLTDDLSFFAPELAIPYTTKVEIKPKNGVTQIELELLKQSITTSLNEYAEDHRNFGMSIKPNDMYSYIPKKDGDLLISKRIKLMRGDIHCFAGIDVTEKRFAYCEDVSVEVVDG